MFEQVFVALVGFFRRGEPGKLPHGEKLAAITGSVNTPRIGRLTGISEILVVIPIRGQIAFGIEPPHWNSRDGGKPGMSVLINIHASRRANWFFGSFLQSGGESFLGPFFFRRRGMTSFKDVSNRGFGHRRLGWRLLIAHGYALLLHFDDRGGTATLQEKCECRRGRPRPCDFPPQGICPWVLVLQCCA